MPLLSCCWKTSWKSGVEGRCCWKTPSESGVEGRCISTFKLFCMGHPKEINTAFHCSSQVWKTGRIAGSKHFREGGIKRQVEFPFAEVMPCLPYATPPPGPLSQPHSGRQSLACWRQCSTPPSWSSSPAPAWSESPGWGKGPQSQRLFSPGHAASMCFDPTASWNFYQLNIAETRSGTNTFSFLYFSLSASFSLSSQSLFLELWVT